MCGSFATVEEPTISGPGKDMRTGRGGEAEGLWHGRDSKLFRWRGSAGPTVVALRRGCAPTKMSEDSRTRRNTPRDCSVDWSNADGWTDST